MESILQHISFLENRIDEINSILTSNLETFQNESNDLEIKKIELENKYQNDKQNLEISFQNIKKAKNTKLYQIETKLIQKEKQQLKLEHAIDNINKLQSEYDIYRNGNINGNINGLITRNNPSKSLNETDIISNMFASSSINFNQEFPQSINFINLEGLTRFLYNKEQSSKKFNNNLQYFPSYNNIIRTDKYNIRKTIMKLQKEWSQKIIAINKEINECNKIIQEKKDEINHLISKIELVKNKHKTNSVSVIDKQINDIKNKISQIESNIKNNEMNPNKLSQYIINQYQLKLNILNIKLGRLKSKRRDIINDIGQIPSDIEIIHNHKMGQLSNDIEELKDKLIKLHDKKKKIENNMKNDDNLKIKSSKQELDLISNESYQDYPRQKIRFSNSIIENKFKYNMSIIHMNKLQTEFLSVNKEITELRGNLNMIQEEIKRFNIKNKSNYEYQLSNMENKFNQVIGRVIGKINQLRNKYINKDTIDKLQDQKKDILIKLQKLQKLQEIQEIQKRLVITDK